MKIRFQGQYDRASFFAAVRLANSPRSRSARLTFWLALGAFVGVGVATWRAWQVTPQLQHIALYLVLLGILLAFLLQNILPPWLAARRLWQNPNVRRPLQGWADEKGIVYLLPEGERRLTWERFIRLRQRPAMLTLVTREGLMLLFTPLFFRTPTQWQKFLQLVRRKVISVQ